jgi:hypothetical protein
MPITEIILKQIESLGYTTATVNEAAGTMALVAEPTVSIDPEAPPTPRRFRQMVRIDGADEDTRYQAVCQLALQCGIDLEG